MKPTIVVLLCCVLVAATAAVAGVLFMFHPSSKGRRGALGVLAALLASPIVFLGLVVAPYFLDPRIRAYQRFYREIQVGMTRERVLETVAARYPADGKRGRPTVMADTAEQLGFFMNPEGEREPNCEGIFLKLHDGVVTEKEYMAD